MFQGSLVAVAGSVGAGKVSVFIFTKMDRAGVHFNDKRALTHHTRMYRLGYSKQIVALTIHKDSTIVTDWKMQLEVVIQSSYPSIMLFLNFSDIIADVLGRRNAVHIWVLKSTRAD